MAHPKTLNLPAAPSTKVIVIVAISLAGVVIAAETIRRRRRRVAPPRPDLGAFVERFELSPSPQPPPPAAKLPLAGLSFAVSDSFDLEGYVTGFGSPDWRMTHEPAGRTAFAVSCLLKSGARCVGRTVMDELAFGITGENAHYGTPVNSAAPLYIPGGSSSGAAAAVAGKLIDFALGIDVTGCVRIPASFCGVFGYRLSHGIASTLGVVIHSKSLDSIGLIAQNPDVLHRVGHVLLQASSIGPRKVRQFIFADDCFQLSRIPKQKTIHVISKAIESLAGYHPAKHLNIGHHISSNVPTLKDFRDEFSNMSSSLSALKALATTMLLIQRYEFKTDHEQWINTVRPKLGPDISTRVLAALATSHEKNKCLYKIRTELRAALNNLLKEEGILVIPTSDSPLKLNSKKKLSFEFEDRAFMLSSITGMSGCCEIAVPLGEYDGYPISVSLIAAHGADKFLLDTVLDIYSSVQEQISIASNLLPTPDCNGDMDASELLKEKGNAAFKGRLWNKAVTYYSEAIKLNNLNATYYCNRAAAYLELGCYQQAEEDCNQAISIDKKNVKAYLRRGTARETLLLYKEAVQDFRHALVLEPQNKAAIAAEKRLMKRMR